jgi:Holliday junction resolvase
LEVHVDIVRSTRHPKIIGDFGENIICNWLSRSGFEVILVDHTGIDILAYNPSNSKRLGITVKSRTRTPGTEQSAVHLLSYQKGRNDREKLLQACRAFACTPWIAIYVEATDEADVYLTSLENYDCNYRISGKAIDDWKMGPKDQKKYASDAEVQHIHLNFDAKNWKW